MARPCFNLSRSLTATEEGAKEDTENKKSFSFSFKAAPLEEKKTGFGAEFQGEAKMFTNKNLFANPMVIASTKLKLKSEKDGEQGDDVKVTLKKRDSLGHKSGSEAIAKKQSAEAVFGNSKLAAFKSSVPLVQVNPLDSSQSLKIQKQKSQSEDEAETPIIKSLFDIKGNSKYKNPESK